MSSSIYSQNRVQVNIPTPAAEADYIWRNLRDIKFFEANNYQVSFPQNPLIEQLKVKSKQNKLTDADYESLIALMHDTVYNHADYQAGYNKIEQNLALLDSMIQQLNPAQFDWNFKSYETYQVNLTLYGPGGSYNPDEGSILIYTTPEGQFKGYDNPINTLIHEIVHIGIEASIVGKYDVPHQLKERIVDTFVSLNFGTYLPDYRIQNMGDTRTDAYLKSKLDFKELDKIVEPY